MNREHDEDDEEQAGFWREPSRDDSWRQYPRPGEAEAPARIQAGPPQFRHTLESAALVIAGTLLTIWVMPRTVPLWIITSGLAVLTLVTWITVVQTTRSRVLSGYLLAWGLLITFWFTAAWIIGPWHAPVIAALVIPGLALGPLGAVAIGAHREALDKEDKARADVQNTEILRRWERTFAKHGAPGVKVIDVREHDGGLEIRGRIGRATAERRAITYEQLAQVAPEIAVSERRDPDGVYFSQPEGAQFSAADFIMHVRRKRTGPRPVVHLPMENKPSTINRPLGLGLLDNGKEFTQTLREVCVLIIGVRDAGKSNLINVFLAQLAGCVDALIWMIDMKGGRTARPWMIPWLQGYAAKPVIDWVATTRDETKLMLETVMVAGQTRARSGIGWEKIEPSVDNPAIILVCDDVSGCFGHGKREGGISNYGLATLGSEIVELYRSEAIDLIGAGQRAVVDLWGTSGIKSQSEVRFGLRVTDTAEGSRIFPDYPAAAKMLSRLRDPGDCLVKDRTGISPAVHLYRVGSEERITKRALWAGDPDACIRPEPEEALTEAMGEAYSARWDRAEDLLKVWRESAGVPEPGDDDDAFSRIVAAENWDPEKPADPRRVKMREIVREAGWAGISTNRILTRLTSLGLNPPARETVQRWLADDEKMGLVHRGQGGSRNWRWAHHDDDHMPGAS
jgi:hypothetical protein